jgi:hypothetical protein
VIPQLLDECKHNFGVMIIGADVVHARADERHATERQYCDRTRNDNARFGSADHRVHCTTIVPTIDRSSDMSVSLRLWFRRQDFKQHQFIPDSFSSIDAQILRGRRQPSQTHTQTSSLPLGDDASMPYRLDTHSSHILPTVVIGGISA